MRITGGKYCSRQVRVPPGIIRPAMDRMRESMFAILCSHYGGTLNGFSCLDLFAGSGIIALEAASRGCNFVVLVEKDTKKRSEILDNLEILDNEYYKLYSMSVEQYLRRMRNSQIQFDIIHLDPPFSMENKFLLIQYISNLNLLKKEGTLSIHYPKEDPPLGRIIGNLCCEDDRSYGRSQLLFYRLMDSPA